MNCNFKGIWIPKEIWLVKDLSKMAILLWAGINSLYNPLYEGCDSSNAYLANFLGLKERMLQNYLKELKDRGLLEQVSNNGRIRVLRATFPTVSKEGRVPND